MQSISHILESLSRFNGVQGCALVEAATGMVWHHAGQTKDMELVGEAAVEFWRTQRRVAVQLQALGELRFVTFKYTHKTVALVPCNESKDLVLVCIAASQGVDWRQFVELLPDLRTAVQSYINKNG